jgi:hypothetical protein
MADEKKLLTRERELGRAFDVFEADHVQNLFTYGIGRSFVGPVLTTIELFNLTGSKPEMVDGVAVNVEEREMFCRLTIPTGALMEACGKLIELAAKNSDQLDDNAKRLRKVISDAISKAGAAKL